MVKLTALIAFAILATTVSGLIEVLEVSNDERYEIICHFVQHRITSSE